MCKSYYDVLRPALVNLEELAVIDHAADDLIHVICLVRIVRYYFIQCVVYASCRVVGLDKRSLLTIIRRQEAQQRLYGSDAFLLVLGREMRYTALCAVYARSTEFLLCDSLAGYGFDNARTSQEHIRCVLDHHSEVSQGRGVYRTSGTWTENPGNLRNDT